VTENKELEFNIHGEMREPEFRGLTYYHLFLQVNEMDWVRGRIKVLVPVDRISKVMEIASKSNFELA